MFTHADDTDPNDIITQEICNAALHDNKNNTIYPLSPYAECGSGDATEWGDGCRIKDFSA